MSVRGLTHGSTAEQAEAMMDSLAKSATEMVQTVQQHEAGLVADEEYAQLVRTLKGHLAMRSYVPPHTSHLNDKWLPSGYDHD
jgi:chemotaxis regulatin CheY-phosphate phosphatase CheZ